MRAMILAAAAIAASMPALAAETTYTRNCTRYSDGVNWQYNCTTSIERPQPPAEPFYRGPATREDIRVIYPSRPAAAPPVPVSNDPNFCGPGFRYTADGCQLAK